MPKLESGKHTAKAHCLLSSNCLMRTCFITQVASLLLGTAVLIMVAMRVLPKPKTPVYLMDTYCYKGPDQLRPLLTQYLPCAYASPIL